MGLNGLDRFKALSKDSVDLALFNGLDIRINKGDKSDPSQYEVDMLKKKKKLLPNKLSDKKRYTEWRFFFFFFEK